MADTSISNGCVFIDIENFRTGLATFLEKMKELFGSAFLFKGIAKSISNDKTELILLDNSKLKASENNKGHIYLVGDKEYASNGSEWVELGFSIDLTPIYNRLDKLESQVNSLISKLDIEDMIDMYFPE